MMMAATGNRRQHVLAIPVPAQGHLNPMMRLCKTLAAEGFTVTIVNIDPIHQRILQLEDEESQPQPQTQRDNNKGEDEDEDEDRPQLDIRKAHLPADKIDLNNGFNVSLEHFFEGLQDLSQGLERLIEALNQGDLPVTCLISDVFMTGPTQKVADKLNIPRIAFFPSCQGLQLLLYYFINNDISTKDALDVLMNKSERSKAEVFKGGLAGLPTIRNRDLAHFRHTHDDTEYVYGLMTRECEETHKRAHTIVVNSFYELEGPAFQALQSRLDVPILPVGPLVENDNTLSLWKEDMACLEWLDQQPPLSVLYISFGSITVLSEPQFQEVVSGLLSSEQRFLWVFRPDLIAGNAQFDSTAFLSDFLSKSNEKGCVVTWAPQIRVLEHPSVGGFLTHCGWNSTVEAIAHGVPMLCWPYFGDQLLDAMYIVEEWKVGLRFEAGEEDGLVKRDEVERAIRALMEGDKSNDLRKKATELKDVVQQSLSPGGTSHKSIQTLIQSLKDLPQPICQ